MVGRKSRAEVNETQSRVVCQPGGGVGQFLAYFQRRPPGILGNQLFFGFAREKSGFEQCDGGVLAFRNQRAGKVFPRVFESKRHCFRDGLIEPALCDEECEQPQHDQQNDRGDEKEASLPAQRLRPPSSLFR